MTAPALLEMAARRAAWYSRIALGEAHIQLKRAWAAGGAPLPARTLTLDCAGGNDASGLFSEAAAVIGCLEHYLRHPSLYAGMRVDFHTHGLYYDCARGPNWWEYYFEPIALGECRAAALAVPDWQHDAFAERVELAMPRRTAAGLVRRHMRPAAVIRQRVDAVWRSIADGTTVIGVHYRGTDKWEGARPVPYDTVIREVERVAQQLGDGWRVFLATDEQSCVTRFSAALERRLVRLEIERSGDGTPLHTRPRQGAQHGEDAITDCLLLTRCHHLVRTDSDPGLFATFFNPDLPVTLLSTP
ncbi:MAG: hypothetical protein K2Y23_26430 [Cyanobacteria bacterium]|nr:hypothetical protein [Cyanobacteriota bacterium]